MIKSASLGIVRKDFKLHAKDVSPDGTFKCVFATMGVEDKDGDVTLPGFFGKQACVVVPVHDWNHVPIGKATIMESGNEAVAVGKFNLDIPAAKDWFAAMQFDMAEGQPLMEWSYGFKVLEGGGQPGAVGDKRVRFLGPLGDGTPGCKVYEVSPVLVGAGEKTRTLAAKVSGDDGKKFCDEASEVLDAAEGLVVRGKSLADLRAKDGRELSPVNKERLALLADSLVKVAGAMTALVAGTVKEETPAPVKEVVSPELAKEVARALKLRAGIQA